MKLKYLEKNVHQALYKLSQRKSLARIPVYSMMLLLSTSFPFNVLAKDNPYEYIATEDIEWPYLLEQTWHPENAGGYSAGHIVSGNEKLIFANDVTVSFDFVKWHDQFNFMPAGIVIIQSFYYDSGYHAGPVIVRGKGTVWSQGGDIGIVNYDGLGSEITIEDSDFIIEDYTKAMVVAQDGSVSFINNAQVSATDVPVGIQSENSAKVNFKNVKTLKLSDGSSAINALNNSKIGFENITDLIFSNFTDTLYSVNNASIEIDAENLEVLNTNNFAYAADNSKITVSAKASSNLNGTLITDGVNSTEDSDPATISLNLGQNTQSIGRNTNSFKFQGDAIAANKGIINLNLGNGSYWAGRSDDFKDADSADWKVSHEGEFNNLIPNLQSSGRVNVTLGDGAYWNVTGQSWVSKLDGNGTIDLRGSETGGYAIHIGEITGSNTFLVNLSKDNKDESDMIYVYDGSGAAEQHVVISNRDEVLNGMKVGDRVRFATVANASGGFVSEGMETEIAGSAAKTFGRSTQIRDAGVKNVNFKVVYEPYNTDQTTSEEDLGYNGGEGFDDIKPGNDYVETIYSQGENPYNVYIQRDEDIAEVTDPDDPTQNVTDAGRTIIDHARANYANAVQLDTLNKRQGEMRFSQGHEDGLWARIRHDDIGKRSSFRLDNTMVEVGVDSRYVKETGEFHTGVAFDYMNGDTDYHHISGEGDLDRYGVWFYTTWLGNEGDYTDFIIKCSLIDNEYKIYAPTTGEKITGDYDNNVISVSLEHGKKYSNEESWFIEPQAQLQYAYVTSAEYTNSQGTDVRLDGIHSLIGRVGVRAGKDVTRDNPFTFYARGDIMYEFMGKQDIKAKDTTGTMRVRYENDDTWYSVGLGMSYLHNKDKHYYLEAEKVFGGSNTSSYIVSGGVRFLFD